VDAWNAKNLARFLAGFTDAGLRSSFDFPDRATAEEELGFFIGEFPVSFISLTNVQVTGGAAVGNLILGVEGVQEATRQTFIYEGGIWKIDEGDLIRAPVPAGATVVDMRLQEFAFVYDRNQVTSGRFVVDYQNIGRQAHEIAIVRLDTRAPTLDVFRQNLPALFSDAPPPPEIELVAGRFDIQPGDSGNMVLLENLSPGRYSFVCLFPDTDDPEETPHIFKGMFSDFVVGPGGTATSGPQVQPVTTPTTGVRPPSTGDAGLVGAGGAESRLLLLAFGSVLLIGGASGLVLAVRRAR
jgi:hypothetical protein